VLNSVVTVAGICNSVGGSVLFYTPLQWRWQISVLYAPCIAGEGQSPVPFPSPSHLIMPHTSTATVVVNNTTTWCDRHGSRSRDRSLRRSSRSTAH